MQKYLFVLRADASDAEQLGFMALPNDDEAIAFAEQVARDLARDPEHRDLKVAVVKDRRTVGTIPIAENGQTAKRA